MGLITEFNNNKENQDTQLTRRPTKGTPLTVPQRRSSVEWTDLSTFPTWFDFSFP